MSSESEKSKKQPVPNSMRKQKIRKMFNAISRDEMTGYFKEVKKISEDQGFPVSRNPQSFNRRELLELFKITGTPVEFDVDE